MQSEQIMQLENDINKIRIDLAVDNFVNMFDKHNVALKLSDQRALEDFEKELSKRGQLFSDFVSYIILIKELNPFLRQ